MILYQSLLEDMIWMTLPFFYVLGWIMLTAMPIIIFLFWKKWMPKPARTLFWAARRKTPPLLLCHDSGRGELTTIIEKKGEGIVVTNEGKYKILPRWFPKSSLTTPKQLSESSDEESGDNEDGEGQEKDPSPEMPVSTLAQIQTSTEKFILDYSDWVVKRTNLIGLDMPIFVGYTGKLCLLNLEALALYEAGEMCIKIEDRMLFNPNKIEGKNIEDALQPLLLVDARKIKEVIYNGFDQTQIAGVVADSEEIGRIGKGISPQLKIFLIVVVIAGIAIGAVFILPQILGQQPTAQNIQSVKSFLWKG